MSQWVTEVFKDKGAAERAVEALERAGLGVNDISVMMSEDTRTRNFTMERHSKAAEGATTGGIVGGAIGAIVAGLTATGSIAALAATGGAAAPLVAGPLAAALAGLGAGAVGGGVIGGLVGLGIPEVQAKQIEQRLHDGGIVVAVNASDDDAESVQQVLADCTNDKAEVRARSNA